MLSKVRVKKRLAAYSLVEVLVSLVLLSVVVIYLLQISGSVLKKAAVLDTKRQVSAAAADVAMTLRTLMYTKYLNDDWATLLRSGVVLEKVGEQFQIGGPNTSCRPDSYGVAASCPSLESFNPKLNKFGYSIEVTYFPPTYQVDITVGCLRSQRSCQPQEYPPIKLTLYLIKR